MYGFAVGREYTRKQVFNEIGIPDPHGGPWYTGYAHLGADYFVFCGVNAAGRTGHNYRNRFLGPDLIWYAKNGTKRGQADIEALLRGTVYVFYRGNDRHPFTFAGIGKPSSIVDSSPVQVTWSF